MKIYFAELNAYSPCGSLKGRNLLKYGLHNSLGISLEETEIATNSFGKPFLKEYSHVKFNISHCDGLVACGIATSDIGIDVEKIRPFHWNVAKRVCGEEELNNIYKSSSPEKQFFSYWTLKESLGKAMGVGINYKMKDTDFKIEGKNIFTNISGFHFQLYEVFNKYLLAVCLKKDDLNIELKEE